MSSLPFAALVVLRRPDGSVLGVSRRGRPDDVGLPGGKLDDGETPLLAAARELLEETGVIVDPRSLSFVYSGHDGHCDVVTFSADSWIGEPRTLEPGIEVSWTSWDILTSGSFGDYNRRVRDALPP